MKILDKYIGREIITSSLLVLFIFIGLEFLVGVSTELPDLGEHGFTFFKMILYVAVQLPATLYMLFPIIAFIGSLIGLGRLASGSELTIMQSVGLSIGRITRSVILSSLVLIIVVTVIGEGIAPKLQFYSDQIKSPSSDVKISRDVWLKHNDSFLHIDRVVWPNKLINVSKFVFKGDKLVNYSFAKYGIKINNMWNLKDVTEHHVSQSKVIQQKHKTQILAFNFTQDSVKRYKSSFLNGSVFSIWKIIRYKKISGLSSGLYEYVFWQRIIQPFTTVLLICLGVPFVFGSLRSTSTSMRLVLGISIGIVFYMLNRFFGPISLIYQLPPWFAAASPTLLFALFYIYLYKQFS